MFKEEVANLKQDAELAKMKLLYGELDYAEAVEMVKPYINAVNEKSKSIAKKYNQRPKLVSVKGYLR